LEILRSGPMDKALERLSELPARRVVSPLFSLLLSTDSRTKWSAVNAIGVIVSRLADLDMESARVIIRRLMWQLNDESGGIGWGCPEAIGEILARQPPLAEEFASILVSYVREDGNFLEYEPLERGAVWGIGRLGQVNPLLVEHAKPHLLPFLEARDASLRGLAAWALGVLRAKEARERLEALLDDDARAEIYLDGEVRVFRVMDLAREALKNIL